jgi:hypothetical protein
VWCHVAVKHSGVCATHAAAHPSHEVIFPRKTTLFLEVSEWPMISGNNVQPNVKMVCARPHALRVKSSCSMLSRMLINISESLLRAKSVHCMRTRCTVQSICWLHGYSAECTLDELTVASHESHPNMMLSRASASSGQWQVHCSDVPTRCATHTIVV